MICRLVRLFYPSLKAQLIGTITLSCFSLEASEDVFYNESGKDSSPEPIHNCPQVTVSVTNESNDDSKEQPNIDQEKIEDTDTLDIDPGAYEGKTVAKTLVLLLNYLLFDFCEHLEFEFRFTSTFCHSGGNGRKSK